jgi:hypothetical protein
MFRRLARNPLTLLTALTAVFALYMGCAEDQPISAPFTRATVNLSPRAFPSPPDGMIYELWLQKLDGSDTSLGRFGWDQDLYVMRDPMGVATDRNFPVDLNILDWDFLSVSVENISTAAGSGPGPIFMRDRIFSPDEREFLLMKYPIDFSGITTGFVTIETPTDGSFSNDSAGIWFAIYSRGTITTQDTIGASATELVQVPRSRSKDAETGSTLDTIGIDSVMKNITYNRYSRFNLDTIIVTTARSFFHTVPINWFDTLSISAIDTTLDTPIVIDTTMVPPDTSFVLIIDTTVFPPDTSFVIDTTIDTSYNVDSSSVQYIIAARDTFPPDTIDYGANRDFIMQQTTDLGASTVTSVHQFDNGFSELFDLTGTGWHYKGWVLGPFTGSSPSEFVRMNVAENKETNWEKVGRTLFTTGIFHDTLVKSSLSSLDTTFYGMNPDGEDSIIVRAVFNYWSEAGYNTVGSNSNPFAAQPTVSLPPFPGEDFLSPSLSGFGPVLDFHGNWTDTTIVFVTVEPDNYSDSTKNFPLILMSVEINFTRGTDDGGGSLPPKSDPFNSRSTYDNNFELKNQSPVNFPIANKRKSWPHILVDITLE